MNLIRAEELRSGVRIKQGKRRRARKSLARELKHTRVSFPKFGVAADPVILRDGKVLLMRRSYYPYEGKLELPGGFLEKGETVEHACVREAKEETGLQVRPIEILGVYSEIGRDPRGQIISVAFVCEPRTLNVSISEEATEAQWFGLETIDVTDMAFDHGRMIQDLRRWMNVRGTFWSEKS